MSKSKEKLAYLQGLAEGLNLDKNTKEGKLFTAIIDLLDEMIEDMEDIEDQQEELSEYIEAIDQDLGDLESEVYGEDDYPDEDEDEEWDEECDYVEVECPECHETVRFDCSILADDDVIEITCPNCDHVVYVNDEELEMEAEED